MHTVRRSILPKSVSSGSKLVLGSGSNVVDVFFPVRKLPQPGDKQYYAAETCTTDIVVGGVTLNHLSWSRALGTKCGLMALQKMDCANGQMIRAKLKELGVSIEYVRVSDEYSTSVSHILLDEGTGERTILMAPASTSRLTAETMRAEFDAAVRTRASMVTTEISQVPLSGVEVLLDGAAAAGVPSFLDVDVTPATATGPARLGTLDELKRCVGKASVLKLTASAAGELLALVRPGAVLENSLENVARQLADAWGSQMCVVTDGSRGSALALGRPAGSRPPVGLSVVPAVTVPIYSGVTQRDATGAGDAFFGGVVAAAHAWGMPASADGLDRMGRVAAAAGAACVEVIGALPVPGVSQKRMEELCPDAAELVTSATALDRAAPSPATEGDAYTPGASAKANAAAVAEPPGRDLYWDFVDSIQGDAEALVGILKAYVGDGGKSQGPVNTAVAALASCGTASGGGRHVYTTGIGKSGAVAARFALSLRSIGVKASFVHGCEWSHGDLGAVGSGDVIVAFSHSGKTAELLDVAARVKAKGARVLSITNDGDSPLAAASEAHLAAPIPPGEFDRADRRGAELLGSVPTRSIVAQEAVCNALLTGVVCVTGFDKAASKANHPGGSIGAALK